MGFTNENILSKKVNFWGADGNVIGVVKDFNFKPLNNIISPFILRYHPWERYFNLLVKITSGNSQQVIQQTQKLYKKYEAEVPFQYSFIADDIEKSYADQKRTASIILLFAGFTIFVSCLGLFGLTVYTTEQRVKEIGIRKVLGATLASITTLLAKDFLSLLL